MDPVNLVQLDDAAIRGLMTNSVTRNLVPCLKGAGDQWLSTQKGGSNCQKCERNKATLRANALNSAKNCIRSLRGETLAQLKKQLNAKQLRVAVMHGGKRIEYTL